MAPLSPVQTRESHFSSAAPSCQSTNLLINPDNETQHRCKKFLKPNNKPMTDQRLVQVVGRPAREKFLENANGRLYLAPSKINQTRLYRCPRIWRARVVPVMIFRWKRSVSSSTRSLPCLIHLQLYALLPKFSSKTNSLKAQRSKGKPKGKSKVKARVKASSTRNKFSDGATDGGTLQPPRARLLRASASAVSLERYNFVQKKA